MGSNLNPADIKDFLRVHRNAAHAYGRSAYNNISTARDNEPRSVLAVSAAALLRGGDDDGEAYFDDDAHSEYTAVSAVTSHASTIRSAAPPSIFSNQDGYEVRSVSQSTAPSRVGPYPGPTFLQQFPGPNLEFIPGPSAHAHQTLWCEYSGLLGCTALFWLDDEAGWIEHHVQHLCGVGGSDSFPHTLMCWFCDEHAPFEAAHPRDAHANFVLRMQHVREHILSDPYPSWTSEHTRPDFHVVQHLWQKGVLRKDVYDHAMGYNELPKACQLPGSQHHQPHSHSASSHHRAVDMEKWERGERHDLAKEKRAERRRLKERLQQGGGGGGGSSSSSNRKKN